MKWLVPAFLACRLILGEVLAADGIGLEIVSIRESSRDPLSVCLILNGPAEGLISPGALEELLSVSQDGQEIPCSASVRDRRICVDGLRHGQSYDIAFMGERRSFRTSDAPPSIAFAAGPLIGRDGFDGLAVTSVNLEEFEARLYRLSESALGASELYRHLPGAGLNAAEALELIGRDAVFLGRTVCKTAGGRNIPESTPLKLRDLTGDKPRGVYLLALGRPGAEFDDGTEDGFYLARLLTVSDLALTVYRGEDGLTAAVRTLRDAAPAAGAEIALIARNNEVLAAGKTDKNGYAHFESQLLQGTGGRAPLALTVSVPDDGQIFDLRSEAIYFDGRGRTPAAAACELFAYTDRELYAPGDTVHLTALLRDRELRAISSPALQLNVVNDRGLSVGRYTLRNLGAGAFEAAVELDSAFQDGLYHFNLSFDGQTTLGSKTVRLERFSPQSCSGSLESPPEPLAGGEELRFRLRLRYNYGAPVSSARVAATVTLAPDNHPFEDGGLRDFFFGESSPGGAGRSVRELEPVYSDADGLAEMVFRPDEAREPRKLTLSAEVLEPGGSVIHAERTARLSAGTDLIGVMREGNEFYLTLVDAAGRRRAGQVRYRLYRVNTGWQYVLEDERWRYAPVPLPTLIASGRETLADNEIKSLIFPLEDGAYRLELTAGDARTGFDFSQGTGRPASAGPERFPLIADRESYRVGDVAVLSFDSPADAEADLALGSDSLSGLSHLRVQKGFNQIQLKITASMGTGIHALLTLYSPSDSPGPAGRSLGLAYLPVAPDNSEISVKAEIGALRPNSRAAIPLSFTGGGGETYYTAALIGEDLLSLTDFKPPEPYKELNAPKRFAISIQDLYGRQGKATAPTADGIGPAVPPVPESGWRPLALYQGVTRAVDGRAVLELELPDRTGPARLMIVAFNDRGVGSLVRELDVSDALSLRAFLPEALYDDERINAVLQVRNLSGEEREVSLRISCEEDLKCAVRHSLKLDPDQTAEVPFSLTASQPGLGYVIAEAQSGDFSYKKAFPLPVSRPALPAFMADMIRLAAGETAMLDPQNVQSFGISGLPNVFSAPFLQRILDIDISDEKTAVNLLDILLRFKAKNPGLYAEFKDEINARAARCARILQSAINTDGLVETGFRRDVELSLKIADVLERAALGGFRIDAAALKYGRRLLVSASHSYDSELSARALSIRALNSENVLSEARSRFDSGEKRPAAADAAFASAFVILGDRARAAEALAAGFGKLEEYRAAAARLERAAGREKQSLIFRLNALSRSPFYDNLALIAAELRLGFENSERIEGFHDHPYLTMPLNLTTLSALAELGSLSPEEMSHTLVTEFEAVPNNSGETRYLTTTAIAFPPASSVTDGRLGFKRVFMTPEGVELDDLSAVRRGDELIVVDEISVRGPAPVSRLKKLEMPFTALSKEKTIHSGDEAYNEFLGRRLSDPGYERTSANGLTISEFPHPGRVVKTAALYRVMFDGSFAAPEVIIYDVDDPRPLVTR